MGLGHFAIGLAAKPAAARVPLWVLLAATEVLDILWGVFALASLDSLEHAPWSHSLAMAGVWAIVGAVLTGYIYHSAAAGLLVGGLVASHWGLDFISHPMTGGPPNLPLLPLGDAQVGLGLYSAVGMGVATIIEMAMLAIGAVIAAYHRRQALAPDRSLLDIQTHTGETSQ